MLFRRRMRAAWVLLAVLALGVTATASSTVSEPACCYAEDAAGGNLASPAGCQWTTPTACCEGSLAAQTNPTTTAPPASAVITTQWPVAIAIHFGRSDLRSFVPREHILLRTTILRL